MLSTRASSVAFAHLGRDPCAPHSQRRPSSPSTGEIFFSPADRNEQSSDKCPCYAESWLRGNPRAGGRVNGRSRMRSIASSRTLLGLLAMIAACTDATRIPSAPSDGDSRKLRDGVVVSGPVASSNGTSASLATGTATSQLTYVSMPPGTLVDGDSVRVANVSVASASAIAPMGGGGFDPVPIEARENDSLEISVFRHGIEGVPAILRVPHQRAPAVIRTTPAPGRTDVPLNQSIVIVLSQPLDASTVSSSTIQLTSNGSAVPASAQLQFDQPWVVLLSPAARLTANTSYTIVITTGVKDANGSALPVQVSSEFSTSSLIAAITSISVRATGTHGGQSGTSALAAVGGSVEFLASTVSSQGDTVQPDTSEHVLWSSSDTHVATLSQVNEFYPGLESAQAISPGTAIISACLGIICGSGTITVRGDVSGVAATLMADLNGIASRVWDMKGRWAIGSAFSSAGGCEHAFLWSASTSAEDLGQLPGQCYSSAQYLSSGGDIVIGEGDTDAELYPTWWVWTRSTGMRRLDSPTGAPEHWFPDALDSLGNIEFYSDSNRNAIQDVAGNNHVLSLPTGWVVVGGMNNRHQITVADLTASNCDSRGICDTECTTVAHVWDFTAASTVATLEPRDPKTSAPLAICPWRLNNNGVVAGSTFTVPIAGGDTSVENAFRWSAQRGFEFAPPIGPGITAEGGFLNEGGDLTLYLFSYVHVGQDSVFDLSSAVWMADGRIVRLGSLGGDWTAANGINDEHLVAGHSQVGSSTGQQHAVYWDLSTSSQSLVAQPTSIVHGSRSSSSRADGAPPKHAWQRNTIRHWSKPSARRTSP
jgi:hypothetical protein